MSQKINLKIPALLHYSKLPFEHRGVSMAQWSPDGKWLSVQTKPVSRRIAYQLNLFYFPRHNGLTYKRFTIQDDKENTIFYSLRWSQKSQQQEFCALSGGFKLYWGFVRNDLKKVIVYPLSDSDINVTQPCWLRFQNEDYIAFLGGSSIYIGKLSKFASGKPRSFLQQWKVDLGTDRFDLHGVNYFQAYAGEDGIQILICGYTKEGKHLFWAKLSQDMKKIVTLKKIDNGTFKLPEWNKDGSRALIYKVKKVNQYSSAQELYLYLYTHNGSGNILGGAPTIQNREKEPEHDYLGPTWEYFKIKGKVVEGSTLFFKQKEKEQRFMVVYFPSPNKLNYESVKIKMNDFPITFGRGRRMSFAGNNSHLVAFSFYNAAKLKQLLYLGLVNFRAK